MNPVNVFAHPLRSYRSYKVKRAAVMLQLRQTLFWTLLMRQRRWIKWVIIAMVAGVISQLLFAQATVAMVDNGIVDQAVPLESYLGYVTVLAVFTVLSGFATKQIMSRFGFQIEFDLRTWLYTRVHAAELRQLDAVATGQLVTRSMTDLATLENLLRYLPLMTALIPVVLALSLYLLVLAPPLAVLAIAALPVNLWLLRRFRVQLWGLSWAELNERAEVATAVDEPVRGIRVVKAFGREDYERARVHRAAVRAYRYAMTRTKLLARYDVLIKLIPIIVNGFVMIVGTWMLIGDRLSVGTFLIATQVAVAVVGLASILDELASAWQYLRGSQSRLVEVLTLGTPPLAGRDLPPVSSGLTLDGVEIAFERNVVLAGLDLAVGPGELVVLTGPPRSGKSTVAALASGLLAPQGGAVVVDGIDVHALDSSALRRAVRVVTEEPILFAGTVRENLDLGGAGHTDDERMLAAIHAAGADDILADLPNGLDSPVGDRGLTLSGGQRQRLALARALVEPPRVLVLDDALSAVNPVLEVEIVARLRAHDAGMAILCITRREGPTRLADRVVRLPEPVELDVAPITIDTLADELMLDEVLATKPADERLEAVVDSLAVDEERPPVGDHQVVDGFPGVLRLGAILKGVLAALMLVLVVNAVARLGPDVILGAITDRVEDDRTEGIYGLASLVFLIGAVYAASAYFFRILLQRFSQSVAYLLRRRVFLRLTRLGVDYFDRELPGHVATRVVNDLDTALRFLEQSAARAVQELGTFVLGLVAIIVLAPATTGLVITFAIVLLVLTALQIPVSMRAYGAARDQLGHVVAKFEEDFAGRAEIRQFGATAKATRRFVEAAWELRRRRRWAATVVNVFTEVIDLATRLVGPYILFRAGNAVLAGTLTVGTALTVRLMAQRALEPVPRLGDAYGRFLDLRVSWRRLRQPFEAEILVADGPGARPCPPLVGEVVFDAVIFGYPGTDRAVLHEVSFRVEPGSVTAIVGYTGAGKSSIAKLIGRIYDPDAGAVRIDGLDLRDLELAGYRSRLGVVPQEAFVFRGTVASNIGYSRPEATGEEIVEAARAVGAYDELAGLEGGFGYVVEEEGRNLTAAQRQLIAIARAWLARPDILVLDEATSSLDGPLEDRVLDAVARLGVTTIEITHRDNVARRAHQVIVLAAGRVVESGSPADLIGTGGAFDRLWAIDDVAPVRKRTRRAAATARASRP